MTGLLCMLKLSYLAILSFFCHCSVFIRISLRESIRHTGLALFLLVEPSAGHRRREVCICYR